MSAMEWEGVMVSGIIGAGSVLLLILPMDIVQDYINVSGPNSPIGIGVCLTDKKKAIPTITKQLTNLTVEDLTKKVAN